MWDVSLAELPELPCPVPVSSYLKAINQKTGIAKLASCTAAIAGKGDFKSFCRVPWPNLFGSGSRILRDTR